MSIDSKNIIALDCGNSSFRVVLGRYSTEKIKMETVYRVENNMHNVNGYYYWDILNIFTHLKAGIKKAISMADGKIDSIGVSTWGVDFCLFDKEGFLLNNPLSYRNKMGIKEYDNLSQEEKKKCFEQTGVLCDKINSIYMIKGMQENMPTLTQTADKLLMIPDIINYMFTNVMRTEKSEFSTTQLLNSKTRELDEFMIERFCINKNWFPAFVEHGEVVGNITEEVKKELRIDYDIPVVCVAGHDTGSAVAAIPAQEDNFIFISSGTWSLIGTELEQPLISEKAYECNFTNEIGCMNMVTLLKNSIGLFIIQRVKKEYEEYSGKEVSWDYVISSARNYKDEVETFDVNNRNFFNPAHMSKAIWSAISDGGDIDYSAVIKSVYCSLAHSYKEAIGYLCECTMKKYEKIYIVGGGSKNDYLNQLTADMTGMEVIACSPESTALGNLAVQLKYYDSFLSLKDIRKIICNSINIKSFKPLN